MPVKPNEITKEMLAKAMQCETADDLVALAKTENIELTKAEAEAFLTEMDDFELDDNALKQVAGGALYERCEGHCYTLDGCGALT